MNPPDAAALDAAPEALADPDAGMGAVAEPDAPAADEPAKVADADAPDNGADAAGRDAEFTDDAMTLEAAIAEAVPDAADEGPWMFRPATNGTKAAHCQKAREEDRIARG